jgi:hypothetical protein
MPEKYSFWAIQHPFAYDPWFRLDITFCSLTFFAQMQARAVIPRTQQMLRVGAVLAGRAIGRHWTVLGSWLHLSTFGDAMLARNFIRVNENGKFTTFSITGKLPSDFKDAEGKLALINGKSDNCARILSSRRYWPHQR